MHFVAVGGGKDDALFPDVKRAAVAAIQLFVRIFLAQFEEQGREVTRVAAGGLQIADCLFVGVLVEALVPINFQRRHIAARRNVPADAAARRVTLVAAAPGIFHFDAARMFYFEGPVNAVEHMATHVADRAVAEVVPAVPFMRMKVRVIIAVRRRTNPRIPMQTGGHG